MKSIHIIWWVPTNNRRSEIPGAYNFYGPILQKSEIIEEIESEGYEYEIEEYDDDEDR